MPRQKKTSAADPAAGASGKRGGLAASYPYYLANRAVASITDLEVLDKYSGTVATRVAFADAATVRKAIAAAHKARPAMAAFPPDARREVIEHCVMRFGERADELALARSEEHTS